MKKSIFVLATLLLSTSIVVDAVAQIPSRRERVDDIETMLERGRWGEALVALERYRRGLDPIKDVRQIEWSRYHTVRTAVELGAADAELLMEDFVDSYPASVYRNSILFMQACYVCDKGDMQRARTLFDEVDYKGLSSIEKERYNIRVGYIRFIDGDDIAADSHFRKITRFSEYYPHALYHRAYIAYRQGRSDEAYKGFEELLGYDIYKELVPYYMLQIEYRNGNYDAVISQGEQLLKRASTETYADLVRIIAESYFVKGDYANALRYMSNYPEDKTSRQENYIMGYSLYRMARYGDAVKPLSAVCGAEDALTQNAAFHLGDCYVRLKNKRLAAEAFSMASVEGFDPEIAEDAMLNYCRLVYELGGGRFNESINILQAYLQRYPDSVYGAEVKQLLIAAYYNSKDYDAAYAALHEIENPDRELRAVLQKVAVFRAVEAVKNHNWEFASSLLNEAEGIGLVPKYNALALYWQGEVAYNMGDSELAAKKYEDYLRRAPKSEAEYHYANYGRGYAYFALKQMKDATESFEDFVRDYTTRDSYLYDAHNRLGDAHFSLREFADARRAYTISAQSLYPERHYALYQLAMVDDIEKKSKSKIERLKGIVAEGEGDYVDDAWYELGRTYIASERYADGASTLQAFVDEQSSSPYYIKALSDLALAYYNTGRKGEARSCYERVVEDDPQSSSALEAMRGIREIYVSEGRIDDYFAYAERSGVQSDMSIAARDSLTFASAKGLYLNGEVELAVDKFNNYLASFDKGYNRTEALFYLSDCYVVLENNAKALSTMKQLLDLGHTQYTERVLDVYARMSFDEKHFEESAAAYLALYDEAYDAKRRMVASEGYVDATLRYATGEKLIDMADNVANMTDATPWAKRQSLKAKADALCELNRRNEALKVYEYLAATPTTAEGAEAYYRLVENDYRKGDYAAAEQRVYALGECGSMYWQAKIFLLLGDVLAKNGNSFQARATYQSIVDGYSPKDDGIVDEAKERIASLAK